MKYSFMTFSCPEKTLAESIRLAKDLGYDGIEARIDANHNHGIETAASAAQRAEMAQIIRDSGIELCCIATSCRFADPKTNNEMIDKALDAIELAGDLDCRTLRVFGGQLGSDVTRGEAIELVARSLTTIAEKASERSVTVCMETHDMWCNPDHVAAVMQKCSHPAIAVNWDIMHPVRFEGWDMTDAFNVLRPWIRHVHFHDGQPNGENYDIKPIGQGNIDHYTALKLVKQAGLDIYFSGEWWCQWQDGPDVYLPRALATMKSYEQNI